MEVSEAKDISEVRIVWRSFLEQKHILKLKNDINQVDQKVPLGFL